MTTGLTARPARATARRVPVRVGIVSPDPVVRGVLTGLLAALDGVRMVWQAGGPATPELGGIGVDVALLAPDLGSPTLAGDVRTVLDRIPAVVLVVPPELAQVVVAAMAEGARGCLPVTDLGVDELRSAIEHVRRGGCYVSPAVAPALLRSRHGPEVVRARLTCREVQVLELVAAGLSNTDIAESIGIERKTVKNHINNAYGKLEVASRARAIARWRLLSASGRSAAADRPAATRRDVVGAVR